MTPILEIKDLHASVGDTPILKGINLSINAGEIHAVMGPNGSGKSTMSYVLAGREGYEVTGGDILMNGESLLEMDADERARAGHVFGVSISSRLAWRRWHEFSAGRGECAPHCCW